MPITEGLQELGEWSLSLRPETPARVREAVWHAQSTIVVTSGPANPDVVGDDGVLALARYTGVLLNRTDLEIGGAGMAWWLGDRDDQGTIYNGQFVADTYASAYTELVTTFGYLLPGTYPAGGSVTVNYIGQTPTSRHVLSTLAEAYGHEWRVNPDLTVDVNTATVLYGNAEVLLIPGGGRRGGTADEPFLAIDAEFDTSADWEQVYQIVRVVGQSDTGVSSFATSDYMRPDGVDEILRTVYIPAPDLSGTVFPDMTANILAPIYQNEAGRVAVVAVRVKERVEQVLRAGDYIAAYDPTVGLYDESYYVTFDARRVYPVRMRVGRLTWPVREGMGVYSRVWFAGDPAPTYTDLTPYVEWEDGDASLELVANGDVARFTSETAAGRVDPVAAAAVRAQSAPWERYTPTWSSSGTPPSIGDGTLAGAYRIVGTTLHLRGHVTFGSTTSGGTGAWLITLPTGLTSATGQTQTGSAVATDSGTPRALTMAIGSGGTQMVFVGDTGALTTATVPFTFGNGDQLSWNATIELAL